MPPLLVLLECVETGIGELRLECNPIRPGGPAWPDVSQVRSCQAHLHSARQAKSRRVRTTVLGRFVRGKSGQAAQRGQPSRRTHPKEPGDAGSPATDRPQQFSHRRGHRVSPPASRAPRARGRSRRARSRCGGTRTARTRARSLIETKVADSASPLTTVASSRR